MKKIIFALSLIAAVAVAPSIYAVSVKSEAISVLDKGEGKKKKKKDCDASKCEKGKKSCCSGAAKEAAAEPAK